MFSKDIKDWQDRAPRTLQQSKFGPYSKLHVEPKKMPLRDKLMSFAFAVAIGVGWYVIVGIKAGAQ